MELERRHIIFLFSLTIFEVILGALVLQGSSDSDSDPPCCDLIPNIYQYVGGMVKLLSETNRNLTKVQKEVESLRTESEKIAAEILSARSFYVILSEDIAPKYSQPIQFDRVVVDVGENYNLANGTFTADRSGVYRFTWSIETTYDNYIFSELMHNNLVAGNSLTGDKVYYSVSTSSAVLILKEGDSVWVRVSEYSSNTVIKDTMTSFSGFLKF